MGIYEDCAFIIKNNNEDILYTKKANSQNSCYLSCFLKNLADNNIDISEIYDIIDNNEEEITFWINVDGMTTLDGFYTYKNNQKCFFDRKVLIEKKDLIHNTLHKLRKFNQLKESRIKLMKNIGENYDHFDKIYEDRIIDAHPYRNLKIDDEDNFEYYINIIKKFESKVNEFGNSIQLKEYVNDLHELYEILNNL